MVEGSVHDSAYKGDFDHVKLNLEKDSSWLTKQDTVSFILYHLLRFQTVKVCHKLSIENLPHHASRYSRNHSFQNERLLLHWAAVGGHLPIVTLLLEKGSAVDPCDDVCTNIMCMFTLN